MYMYLYNNKPIFGLQSEAEAANLTDKSDVFSPVRLNYEHHLFFIFESVKHRDYYLGTNGDGQTKLVNTHSEAYRDSETLIKLIDPGRCIVRILHQNDCIGEQMGSALSIQFCCRCKVRQLCGTKDVPNGFRVWIA